MNLHDEDYLFRNGYAPLTTSLYFLKSDFRSIADLSLSYFRAWAKGEWTVGSEPVMGGMEELVRGLEPLRSSATRFLVVPTKSPWTAMFSNCRDGMEQSLPSVLARRLQCGFLRVVDAPGHDEVRVAPTSMPARMFSFSADPSQPAGAYRVVELLMEDGWEFEERGSPLPGEDTSVYRARRLRDRFPHSQLRALCLLVGTRPFELDFYDPTSAGAIRLFENLPEVEGDAVSLVEAQARRRG